MGTEKLATWRWTPDKDRYSMLAKLGGNSVIVMAMPFPLKTSDPSRAGEVLIEVAVLGMSRSE